jgi:hypothetical protein
LDDSHLGYVPGSLGPVRRNDQVYARSAQPDEFSKRFAPTSRAGASDRPQPESGDDSLDQLAVTMPADEDICFRSAIRERHHQLLRVPERDDHALALRQQGIDVLRISHPDSNAATEQADRSVPDRGHAGERDLRKHRFQHGVSQFDVMCVLVATAFTRRR